jgi:3',5'-nucleoside bisphosphate phosphatase
VLSHNRFSRNRTENMFDAHCHTDCSDGNITIEDRIQLVQQLGYSAATITDHDFVSEKQIRRAQAACGDLPYVPGIELSLAHRGHAVHLLGYFIDPGSIPLQNHLKRVQEHDREITASLLAAFQRQGARFGMGDLKSSSLHTFHSMQLVRRLARELYAAEPEALLPDFLRELDDLGLIYADLAPWPVRDAIDLIHQAGGITVLAHPGGRTDRAMQALGFLWHDEEMIQTCVSWGLDGIETHTPVHTQAEITYYEELARRFNLLATSGSDCHGDDPYLGPALMGTYRDLYPGLYHKMLETLERRQQHG